MYLFYVPLISSISREGTVQHADIDMLRFNHLWRFVLVQFVYHGTVEVLTVYIDCLNVLKLFPLLQG